MDIKLTNKEVVFIKDCLKKLNRDIRFANFGNEPVKSNESMNKFTGYHKYQTAKKILKKLGE